MLSRQRQKKIYHGRVGNQPYPGAENNIQAVYGRDILKGIIIARMLRACLLRMHARRSVFPVNSNIKSRQFSFTIDNKFESREALIQATKYRDISIKC